VTFRTVPHVFSPDAPSAVAQVHELDFWRNRDPLRRFQALLLQRGLARLESLEVIAASARAEVAGAARRLFGDAVSGRNGSVALVRFCPGATEAPAG
jgi:TPP-dependent pyruvate/acetoin dehydrogenase alpha subunit